MIQTTVTHLVLVLFALFSPEQLILTSICKVLGVFSFIAGDVKSSGTMLTTPVFGY